MWEMGGERKARIKKEAKETSTKKANCCASPRIYKEPWVLSAKATLPTYCDGAAGIYLLLDELFSLLKKSTKDFFSFLQFFCSGIPCSCRGRCTSWKVSFTREMQMLLFCIVVESRQPPWEEQRLCALQ